MPDPIAPIRERHAIADRLPTGGDWYARDVGILLEEVDRLRNACELAIAHTDELADAWMRGAINECDGKGGTRSNRNVDVNHKLRAARSRRQPPP